MKPKNVDKLEAKIEVAIAEVFENISPKKLPLAPGHRTLHLMAKAAVAVYEAAAEHERPRNDHD